MRQMRSCIILFLACMSAAMPAGLRAQHFDPEHRHAIEITTGPAPFRVLMQGNSNFHVSLTEEGRRGDVIWRPSVNIAYTYALNERWDVNVMVNFSTMVYRVRQYAILEADPYHPKVDWESGPVDSWTTNSGLSFAVMASARWKWYRNDLLRLYTALGLGVARHFSPWPTPYFSPIGIHIGKKHFYGIAELNVSSAATGCLVGVGFRF